MDYIVIYNSDGDTTVKRYSKEKLIEIINNQEEQGWEWFESWPAETDTAYWGNKMLIIKGSVVVPKVGGYTVE